MDHKNLSYIKDPCKLSRRQAHWSLFLQDFHIEWVVTPGMQMGPTDTLLQKDDLDTSSDNHASSIVPEPVIINALDLTLSQSSPTPLPLTPLYFVFSPLYKVDPHYSLALPSLIGTLTMDICTSRVAYMFPPLLDPPYSTLFTPLLPLATWASSARRPSSNATSGGLDLLLSLRTLLMVVLSANKIKSTPIQPFPLSFLYPSCTPSPLNNYPSTSSLTSPHPMAMTLLWS